MRLPTTTSMLVILEAFISGLHSSEKRFLMRLMRLLMVGHQSSNREYIVSLGKHFISYPRPLDAFFTGAVFSQWFR